MDDKVVAIFCLTTMALGAIFIFNVEALTVVTHIAAGVCGLASGKTSK